MAKIFILAHMVATIIVSSTAFILPPKNAAQVPQAKSIPTHSKHKLPSLLSSSSSSSPSPSLSISKISRTSQIICHASPSSFSDDQMMAMELLIMSLSEESNDEIRRNKLNSLYAEEMAKPKSEAKEFATLFDTTIMRMGEEIQVRAREKAMELTRQQEEQQQQQQQQDANNVASDDNEEGGGTEEVVGDEPVREKSKEEIKLWAFIDMMVQSKSLAKKALG